MRITQKSNMIVAVIQNIYLIILKCMQYIIKSNAFTCKMRAFKNVKQLCKSTSLVVDRSSDLLQP